MENLHQPNQGVQSDWALSAMRVMQGSRCFREVLRGQKCQTGPDGLVLAMGGRGWVEGRH